MDKRRLHDVFTEIVAIRLDTYEQRLNGIWPPDTNLDRWKHRYFGISEKDLPPYTVEINHFRIEVQNFVSMLIQAVDNINKD